MNKKANSTIMIIFEVLTLLAIAYMMITVGLVYGSSDTVFKVNTAEEIRMMVDTLAGIPGEAKVQFPHNVSGYNLKLEKGTIAVFKVGEEESSGKWVTRNFFLPAGFDAKGISRNETTFCLEKERLQTKVMIKMVSC